MQGVRTNQLVGYGLVVGLDSTGDQTSQAPFTVQSLNNMLAQLGITVPRKRHAAAEERGGGRGARGPAGLRQARPDHRHHRQLHRQCQEPARRFAAGDAAARPRRADLRHCAGQSHRQRLRRRGQRRLEAHRQRAELGPHSERRHGRARGALAARRRATPSSSISTIPTSRRRRAWSTSVNKGMGDGIATILDGGSVRVRAPIDLTQRVAFLSTVENLQVEPGSAAGAGDHQFAHRHGGDQQQRDRHARRPCRTARCRSPSRKSRR